MKWITEVSIPNRKGELNYGQSMLSIGSCFAEEIGTRLKDAGFNISVNPFGIIFNPVSILQLVQNTLDGNVRDDLLFSRDMKAFHYGYHSRIFAPSEDELKEKIESIQYTVQRKLLEGDVLVLTFGTAWVYRLNEANAVVANCHKMPAQLFTKELIDLEKLKVFSKELFTKLFESNPKLKVVLTVSPVRHTKDGVRENNISKGLLHLYSQYLEQQFDQIAYFPAYELVMDELRDYRFYKEDLVHPSKQAVNYVFDKFVQSYFDDRTMMKFSLHEKLKKAKMHHFLNATVEEVRKHEEYIQKLESELENIDQ